MASNTRRNWQMPLGRSEQDVTIEQDIRIEGTQVSWGGIWAGVLVALGTLLILSTLGLAVGIAAGNAAAAEGTAGVNPGTVSTAAVIWSTISLLISLFLGGLAATRMGRIWDRGAGLLQGGLVWIITLGAILYLGVRGLSLMASSASMGLTGGPGVADGAAQAATQPETAIGWSPFIISVLSLLAALAGAGAGLRRLTDIGRTGGGSSKPPETPTDRY
jgi:hypothetical protein